MTRDEIIRMARETAQRLGQEKLTRAHFMRETGVSSHQIYSLFPEEGWTGIQREAGLAVRPQDRPLTDEELLVEMHRVVTEVGKIPTWRVFDTRSEVSVDTLRKRFGGRNGALRAYQKWLKANHPDSLVLEGLSLKSKHEIPPPSLPQAPAGQPSRPRRQWPGRDDVLFGAPISFRGLTHAPLNEQGVVYLFGMVSYELGFLVEAVRPDYPDCEAKRCVDSKTNRWQRVRIEFEFRSRNFAEHGHDPSMCDLIVCWENDWPDCPLEVLELRSVIDQLDE